MAPQAIETIQPAPRSDSRPALLENQDRCILCGSSRLQPFYVHRYTQWIRSLAPGLHCRWAMCLGCGLLIQTPRVSEPWMRRVYAEQYRPTAPNPSYLHGKILDAEDKLTWLQSSIGAAGASRTVLDIGCAEGSLLDVFRKRHWTVEGIEPTAVFAAWGRQTYGVPITQGEFTSEAMDNRSFDLVILSHVLEHAYDPFALLRVAAQHISPAGHLLIEVPDMEQPGGNGIAGWLSIDHLWGFSFETLARCLRQAGLPIVRIERCQTPRCAAIRALCSGSAAADESAARSPSDGIAYYYRRLRRRYRRQRVTHFFRVGWKDAVISTIRVVVPPHVAEGVVERLRQGYRRLTRRTHRTRTE